MTTMMHFFRQVSLVLLIGVMMMMMSGVNAGASFARRSTASNGFHLSVLPQVPAFSDNKAVRPVSSRRPGPVHKPSAAHQQKKTTAYRLEASLMAPDVGISCGGSQRPTAFVKRSTH